MPLDVNAMADSVVLAIKTALGPVLERLAAAEARLSTLGDLRDRVVVVETKAAVQQLPTAWLTSPVVDMTPVHERLAAAEARLVTLGDLRDRVVMVETKAAIQQVPTVLEALAPSVVDIAPVYERVAAAEARLSTLGDLRDRVVTIETKAAQPVPPDATVGELRNRVLAIEATQPMTSEKALLMLKAALDPAIVSVTAEIAAIRERLAVIETRAPVPGQPGKDGLNGKDGADGLGFDDLDEVYDDDGRTETRRYSKGDRVKEFVHKTAREIYRGVWIDGKTYDRGDGVTWGGSEWHSNETTTTKPGDGSKAWTLKVKRGRDGKDGRDGHDIAPVVSVGRST